MPTIASNLSLRTPPLIADHAPRLIHIQTHLDQDLSLDLLADEVGLSKYHFHRLFRTVTGETPKSYVDRLHSNGLPSSFAFVRLPVLEVAGMWLPESRDIQPGISGSLCHVAARGPASRIGPARRTPSDAASFRRARRGGIRPAWGTRIVRLARMIVAFIRQVGALRTSCRELLQTPDGLGSPTRSRRRIARCFWASRTMRRPSRPPRRFASTAVFRFPRRLLPTVNRLPADSKWRVRDNQLRGFVGPGTSLRRHSRTSYLRLAVEVIGLPAIEIYQTTQIGQRHVSAKFRCQLPVEGSLGLARRGPNPEAVATERPGVSPLRWSPRRSNR